jgi:hypothetical protein
MHKHYYKKPFLSHGRKKVNKTDPTWNLKMLVVIFTNKLKIMKIAGSRAEFLDFDFQI